MKPTLSRLLLLCACGPVGADVRHCIAADGTSVFTDRRCKDIGAVERRQQAPVDTPARPLRAGCQRTLQDLVL